MANDLQQMVEEVRVILARDDLNSREIPSAINRACRYWEKKGWWFLNNQQIITFLPNNSELTLPFTNLQNLGILQTDGSYCQLRKLSYDNYICLTDCANITGTPTSYAVINANKIVLYPQPIVAGTLSAFGKERILGLVNLTDTNPVLDNLFDLITHTTLYYLYKDYLMETDTAESHRIAMMDEYKQCWIEHNASENSYNIKGR
jgi:hypothetical protein